jgi:hypothetical protein
MTVEAEETCKAKEEGEDCPINCILTKKMRWKKLWNENPALHELLLFFLRAVAVRRACKS